MTGAGGDEIGMERMELRGDDAAGDGLAVVPISPPAPVQPNPMRDRITARVRVLRSLRAPTVQQIEAAQFWEEYLRVVPAAGVGYVAGFSHGMRREP